MSGCFGVLSIPPDAIDCFGVSSIPPPIVSPAQHDASSCPYSGSRRGGGLTPRGGGPSTPRTEEVDLFRCQRRERFTDNR